MDMTFAVTQSDFREHLKEYLDSVNDDNEIVYIARSKSRTAAVISQEKLNWYESIAKSKEDSLEYAIARDQLIRHNAMQDDKIVESDDEYWGQFTK